MIGKPRECWLNKAETDLLKRPIVVASLALAASHLGAALDAESAASTDQSGLGMKMTCSSR
jgi:hypothetical protein